MGRQPEMVKKVFESPYNGKKELEIELFTTVYPINPDFESYQFRSLINIPHVAIGWIMIFMMYRIINALGNDHHLGPNTR